jgi:hypothetical protein
MRRTVVLTAVACAIAAPLVVELGLARAERGGAGTSARPPPMTGTMARLQGGGVPAPVAPGGDGDIVQFAGGAIRVEMPAGQLSLSRIELKEWVRSSAQATATYFGRFPIPYVRLVLEPTGGSEVVMGRAVGRPEPRIVVTMGRRTTAAALAGESLLVHEMVHLAIPDHDIRFLWLHEGIATYVEHVARAQAGLVPARSMWAELARELPVGMPEPHETGGLDGTRSEGRRYWGGALFCLLADVEIRKQTGNRLGLQDALRALQRQGGNLTRTWSIERTLEVADRATGTRVLATLYRQMGNRPHVPDLDRLWRELGVGFDGTGRVVLDDAAPLAMIRRAITDWPSAPLLVGAPRLVRVVDARGGGQAAAR